jgi:hypothetical protein
MLAEHLAILAKGHCHHDPAARLLRLGRDTMRLDALPGVSPSVPRHRDINKQTVTPG